MKNILALALLLPASLFAADLTGTFEAGMRYEAPAEHAPAAVSRMFVRTLARGASSLDLPAAGDGGMIIWTIPAASTPTRRPLGARLTTPTGDVLRQGEIGSVARGVRRFRFDSAEAGIDLPAGTHEVLHVMQTQAANYRLDVDVPADVAGVMVVAAEPDSRITMETWLAPLSRQPGEPVTLHAELRDGGTPIAGAKVTARLAAPGSAAGAPIELADQGNGVYAATLADLPDGTAGAWQARFEADGETAAGVRFARTGRGELIAERGAARLLGDSVRVTRTDGALRVTATADVVLAGAYRFDVIVAGARAADGSRPALAWGEGVRRLEPGTNTLTLDLPAADGELQVDVRLLGLDPIGVAGRVVQSIDQ